MNSDRISIARRFQRMQSVLGYSGSAMAIKLNTSASYISDILNGKSFPSVAILAELSEIGIDVNWLLTGKGMEPVKQG